MKAEVSLSQVNTFLLAKQNLDLHAEQSVGELLGRLIGFYGSSPTSYLSLLSRASSFSFEELDESLYRRRLLVRARSMRGSLFLLPADLFPTAFQATKGQCLTAFRKLIEASGVERSEYEHVAARLQRLTSGRSMTVGEMKEELTDESGRVLHGLNFVVSLMCAEGRLVRARARGGWKSNLWEYARLDEWLPNIDLESISPAKARTALARLYFASFAPTTEEDFRWWSGFSGAEAHEAVEALGEETRPVKIEGLDAGAYLMLKEDWGQLRASANEPPRRVSLLPMWDAYTMAYKHKSRFLSESQHAYVYDKSGNAAPAILLNGRIAGVWEWAQQKNRLTLKAALFKKSSKEIWRELHRAAERFAVAVGAKDVTLLRCPLPRSGARGGINFRSPLAGLTAEVVH